MSWLREHATQLVIVALLGALIYVSTQPTDQIRRSSRSYAGQSQSHYQRPGIRPHTSSRWSHCDFDGDFTNDKPGECPDHH